MVLLREDRYNGKGKREEEVVKNQRRRQPGVREGRRAVKLEGWRFEAGEGVEERQDGCVQH